MIPLMAVLLIVSASPAFAFERPWADSLAGTWDFTACEPQKDMVRDRSAKPDFPQLSPEWFEVLDKSEIAPWDAEWNPVEVPQAWENFLGHGYNGSGWYARFIDIPGEWLAHDRRIWLEFDAVATVAGVFVANEFVGGHVGDYSRWRVEITGSVRRNLEPDIPIPDEGFAGDRSILIAVYVDEMPGHITQGFLSMIAPHHGGIWQDVRLYSTGPVAIEPDGIHIKPDCDTGWVEAVVDYDGVWDESWPAPGLYITYYKQGDEELHDLYISHYENIFKWEVDQDNRQITMGYYVDNPELWSPDHPNMYEAVIELPDMYDGNLTGPPSDLAVQKFAFRTIEIDGSKLLLNDEQFHLRSALQWGYYPGVFGPLPDPETVRAEFKHIKELGFNAETVCLVNMPDYFYDLADEMGVLIWQEYPTWHNDFDAKHLPTYNREFPAYFSRDRNHPSIILRSLSVEAGISDQDVIAGLYALAKDMTNAPVQDNNSWFSHSNPETTDWYGEDNYFNCNQWARHLLLRLPQRLEEYPEKPYIIGESLLFNTWPDIDALYFASEGERWPWWYPSCSQSCMAVNFKLRDRYRDEIPPTQDIVLDYLLPQSTAYSLHSRRFQIEMLHADPRYAGYTMNVVRDMPLIRAGLFDDLGQPRWERRDWKWHGEHTRARVTAEEMKEIGSTATVERPGTYEELEQNAPMLLAYREHPGGGPDRTAAIYYLANGYSDLKPILNGWKSAYRIDSADIPGLGVSDATPHYRPVLTTVLTDTLVDYMERGGTVVLLTGKWPGAMGSHHHFFWRDAFFAPPVGPFTPEDCNALVQMHPYDLTLNKAEVIPVDALGITDNVDPLIRLYDTHDLSEVVTYDALWATKVGEGVLVASSLDHSTDAGQWVLGKLCAWFHDRQFADQMAEPLIISFRIDTGDREEVARRMQDFPATELSIEQVRELAVSRANMIIPLNEDWRFRVDPDQRGEELELARPDILSDGWGTIDCGRSWESQGHSYDGMAWYRKWVSVPDDWAGGTVKLVAEGIDDAYRVWVNGEPVALHGSFTVHEETVWLNQTVTDLTEHIVPGQSNLIVLQVVDIVGQGGVYKPLYLAVE